MHKSIIISIILLVLISACSEEARVIRATKDISEEKSDANKFKSQEEFTVVEPEQIEIDYKEYEDEITDPEGYTEYIRNRKYGTLVDFTQLNPNKCEDVLEDFQAKRKKLQRDLDYEEQDLQEQTQNLKETEAKLTTLLANSSSDPDEIEKLEENIDDDREDLGDKEDEVEDLENELQEVSKTVDELIKECKRIETHSK